MREAIHTVFLYHAIRAGMTMGIVNAGQLGVYEEIEPELRERVEDVVLNRRPDAGERLVEVRRAGEGRRRKEGTRTRLARRAGARSAWRTRWCTASPTYIVDDTEECRAAIAARAGARSR